MIANYFLQIVVAGFGSLVLVGSLGIASSARAELREASFYLKNQIVGISTPASSGTGTIIGRKGNIYTILTAKHVIQSDVAQEEYYAVSPATSKSYRITECVEPAGGNVDLALCKFTAEEQLGITLINFIDKNTPNRFDGRYVAGDNRDSWGTPPETGGRGAGISLPSGAITVPMYRYISFGLQERVSGNKDGYEFVYEASTYPGMSGGPLVGYRLVPCTNKVVPYLWLLAIHGRSEEYGNAGRSGLSLGIPVDLASPYLLSNADNLGIPVNKKAIEKLVQSQYCSD